MEAIEYLSFSLIIFSSIGLIIAPIVFDRRISGYEEGINKYDQIANKMRDFRFKAIAALREYDQMCLINEIYCSVTPKESRHSFIKDNIKGRLIEAHRYISTWDNKKGKDDEQSRHSLSADQLLKEFNANNDRMAEKLTEIYKMISVGTNSRNRTRLLKNRLIILFVILNSFGLALGFINSHFSDRKSLNNQNEMLRLLHTQIVKDSSAHITH